MHNLCDLMAPKDFPDRFLVPEIGLLKNVFRVGLDPLEIRAMARVRETVQIDQLLDRWLTDNVVNNIAADKTGAACEKKLHFANQCSLKIGIQR